VFNADEEEEEEEEERERERKKEGGRDFRFERLSF
jgi:hypothetical protein